MYQIKRLHDICRRNSVNVIDVTEKIEKQNTDLSKLINGVTDCHYNERGKKVVGELLAQAFMGSVK